MAHTHMNTHQHCMYVTGSLEHKKMKQKRRDRNMQDTHTHTHTHTQKTVPGSVVDYRLRFVFGKVVGLKLFDGGDSRPVLLCGSA